MIEATPMNGAMVRHEIDGSSEMMVSSDVQTSALAAQAEAEVKARWAIAQRCPRNIDTVRVRLLRECERPGFAQSARYTKPVGEDKVSGPSIRFVETALRCMGNVYAATTVVSEDQLTRRLQVVVTDLETNVSWPRQISIRKTVERSKADGRTVVSQRTNTRGRLVYEVVATDDELANKESAAVSKAIRTAGLRVIPGDLVDEAMATCISVQRKADSADPNAARKKLADAFAKVGVYPQQLEQYLGHSLETLQPAELEDLRGIYEAIKDGESKWADVLELKANAADFGTKSPPPPTKAEQAPTEAPESIHDKPQGEPVPESTATQAAPQPSLVDQLIAEIRAAAKRTELNALAGRISKLPAPEKAQVLAVYSQRAKEVR